MNITGLINTGGGTRQSMRFYFSGALARWSGAFSSPLRLFVQGRDL
jgi:hypothetical protein